MQLNKKTGAVYLILIGDCLHFKKRRRKKKEKQKTDTLLVQEKSQQQLNPA